MISLNKIKNIVRDITADKEWVNDSHTASEYKGIVSGLERLVRHIELTQDSNEDELKQQLINGVIDRIKFDLLNGDETAIDELLNFTPIQNLIYFLPEKDWEKYQSLNQNKDEG